VQLNPQQLEEAKQMTYGKLKQYRRDRLYTSDKDRVNGLIELLKKARIPDNQQSCQTCQLNGTFNVVNSPNRGGVRNNEKAASPNKPSPNRNPIGVAKQGESAHSNNG
jgi:hypothetical protein